MISTTTAEKLQDRLFICFLDASCTDAKQDASPMKELNVEYTSSFLGIQNICVFEYTAYYN